MRASANDPTACDLRGASGSGAGYLAQGSSDSVSGRLPPEESELLALSDSVVELVRRTEDVDIRRYESMPPAAILHELVPQVVGVLAEADALLSRVMVACEVGPRAGSSERDPLGSPYARFEMAVDEVVDGQLDRSGHGVADIAFLAGIELRQRRERLRRLLPWGNPTSIASECESSLRRVRKGMAGIDRGLSRMRKTAPRINFSSELDVALQVRAAYSSLRARALGNGPPTSDASQEQLRGVGTAISTLVGSSGYPNLRLGDRLALRDLQQRVLAWLKSERDPSAGMMLWQDTTAFLSLLKQINRRAELIEHDAEAIRCIAAAVEESDGDLLPISLLPQLNGLYGYDDEVDRLLESPGRRSVAAWRPVVAALAARFTGAGER